MDFAKLLARVKAILMAPATEWPVIAGEAATPRGLYTGYILLLAAIQPVAGFIKMSVLGVSVPFGGTVKIGIGAGLGSMLTGYVLALVGVYVVALIVDALAPTFGGQKDSVQALKVVTYSYTAAWVASLGQVVPWLGMLFVLAGGLYSIYLLYLGLPVTMKCPREKAVGYTAATIIAALVLGLVISGLVGNLFGLPSMMPG